MELFVFLVVLFFFDVVLHESRGFLAISIMAICVGFFMAYRNRLMLFDYFMNVIKIYVYSSLLLVLYFLVLWDIKQFLCAFAVMSGSIVIACIIRFISLKFLPPYRLMTPEISAVDHIDYHKWVIEKVNLNDVVFSRYCALVIDRHFQYPEIWQKFIAHCQVIGMPVFAAETLRKGYACLSVDNLPKELIGLQAFNRKRVILKQAVDVFYFIDISTSLGFSFFNYCCINSCFLRVGQFYLSCKSVLVMIINHFYL